MLRARFKPFRAEDRKSPLSEESSAYTRQHRKGGTILFNKDVGPLTIFLRPLEGKK